jgi:TonB-dependent receptor
MTFGAAVLALLCSTNSFAAEERGSLLGKVVDPGHLPLPGASVRVEPGALSVVTDRGGSFSVQNLAAGTYKIAISYIGFVTASQEATVTAGGSVKVDVVLQPSTNLAEEVTVTASRSLGDVQALNQKKNADNIVDVLPAGIITSLPNANIADALGRLPSVSLERDEGEGKYVQVRGLQPAYTNVTINGVHVGASELSGGGRAVKLDDVPSDLVGSIELNKTLSADQDSDAIGGSVNLVTKAAQDQTHFSIGTQQGYTFLQQGIYVTSNTGTFSGRFGPDKALGIVLGGSYDYNRRGIDDLEPAPDFNSLPDGSQVAGLPTADYREYSYQRKRYGFAGGLDYRLSPTSTIYLHGLYSDFKNFGDRWVGTPTAGNFLTPSLTDDSGAFDRGVSNRRPDEVISSVSLGGQHILSSVSVDYRAAYSHTRQNYNNAYQAKYSGPSDVAYAVDNSDPNFPRFTVTNGVDINDPSLYELNKFEITNEDTHLNSYEGALNIAVPYTLGDSSILKFGGKYREEDRTNTFNDQSFKAKETFLMSQALDSFTNPDYYFGKYQLGPLPSLSATEGYFLANPSAFKEDIDGDAQGNASNNFTTKEKIAAAYAMSTSKFGSFHVQVGVRMEHTSAQYNAFHVTNDSDGNFVGATPVSADNTYTDFNPSVQLRYELGPSTNLRAVYGRAIARPDIVQLVPTFVQDDANLQVSVGNPDLVPTHSNNFDLLLEHYVGSVGLVSAGGFYKSLSEPIYGSTQVLTNGPYTGYEQNQPINGPSAKVYGVEVAWQQRLSFLPGFLGGLGILANYTYTDSKATFLPSFGRSDEPRLQRTTPNEANVNLTYDKGGFSVRGALTYNSATIFSYAYQDGATGGIAGPLGDTYINAHTQIDAQGSYTFKSGLRILMSCLNISNQVFGFYNGSPQYNIQREFYGPTLFVGLSLNR